MDERAIECLACCGHLDRIEELEEAATLRDEKLELEAETIRLNHEASKRDWAEIAKLKKENQNHRRKWRKWKTPIERTDFLERKLEEAEDYMWDAMWQGCLQGEDEEGKFLDNMGMSTYEGLTRYFCLKGRLTSGNGRIYRLVKAE